ncbi:anti-sigma factor [Candidatus Woesearchaeota archaeon]|nr:anti-sigma factor [Candidatus Woesearchaeota archaeon]
MKLFSSLMILCLLSFSVFAAISDGTASSISLPKRLGVSRISNYEPRLHLPTINQFIALEPTYEVQPYGVGRGGASPYSPRGSARVRSVVSYGYPTAQVSVKTKDLPASSDINAQFEAWLVDDDSGYRLSLGTFTTQQGGVADFRYTAGTYFNEYDVLEITVEPFHDTDIAPGNLVMYGKIKPQSINAPLSYKINSIYTTS